MDQKTYQKIIKIEEKMWWYKARKNIIEAALLNNIVNKKENTKTLLDFGSGTGRLANMMSKYFNVTAIDECKEVFHLGNFKIQNIPLNNIKSNSFDVVTAFDVIEHCENDKNTIAELSRILKLNGFMFLTVPSYQLLWGPRDITAHHFRRYTKNSLKKIIPQENFSILKISYFNFFLFPIFIIDVFFQKILNIIIKKERETITLPNKWINNLFFHIFNTEKKWLKNHNFIFGSSLMLIAKKTNNHTYEYDK